MQNYLSKLSNPKIKRFLLPSLIILTPITLGGITITAIALVHHMDVPTYITSLNTPQIKVAELAQGQLKPIILIDVRSPEEYAEDHIGQSQSVPLVDIEAGFGIQRVQKIAQAQAKANQPQPTIVLYCTSGMRSVKAFKHLSKTGLKFVVLTGGIKAWRQEITAQKDNGCLSSSTCE